MMPITATATTATSSTTRRRPRTSARRGAVPKLPAAAARLRVRVRFHPFLSAVCGCVCCVLVGMGVALLRSSRRGQYERLQREMVVLATDAGNRFSDLLLDAIQPLYIVSGYATEIPDFAVLPRAVGSRPYWRTEADRVFRNVTGICDQPALVQRYDNIISPVLDRSQYNRGVLVNIQFQPYGVTCLYHPMVWNLTDAVTQEPVVVDNRPFVGGDLIQNDLIRSARDGITKTKVNVVGPRPLIQCPRCGNHIILRLPVIAKGLDILGTVPSDTDEMDVQGGSKSSAERNETATTPSSSNSPEEGVIYKDRWGFVTGIVDWDELVRRSGVYESFTSREMAFQLTRNDTVQDRITATTTGFNITTVIAETPGFTFRSNPNQDADQKFAESVRTGTNPTDPDAGQTTGNQSSLYAHSTSVNVVAPDWAWTFTVYYNDGAGSAAAASAVLHNTTWVVAAIVLVAVAVSALLYAVLVQKHDRVELRGRASAQRAKVELERRMTAYFSHELRNPLSAMDSALECMPLNEFTGDSLVLLNSMRLCTSFMSSIMDNLLDARKIEEGDIVLRRDPVSVRALIHAVIDMTRPMLQNKRVSGSSVQSLPLPQSPDPNDHNATNHQHDDDDTAIVAGNGVGVAVGGVGVGVFANGGGAGVNSRVTLDADIQTNRYDDTVLGDEMRLQQILTNIVSNAVKYTQEGSVNVKAHWIKVDNNQIIAPFSESDSQTTVQTHNNGNGSSGSSSSNGSFGNSNNHLIRATAAKTTAVAAAAAAVLTQHRRGGRGQSRQQRQQQQEPRQLCIEVCDTGPGIPEHELDKVFDGILSKSGAPGSGLGLSISRHLVELMGGTIRFESDPRTKPGSQCTILLPLEICTPEPSTDAFSGVSGPFTAPPSSTDTKDCCSIQENEQQDVPMIEEPISILIVDDLQMNRTMLKRRFLKCIAPNCVITEAPTGEEALDIVQNESNDRFDVIIQDYYLEAAGGIMVGTDVVAAMRSMRIDSVIVGCSGNEVNDAFLSAGADLVWNKPLPSNQEILKSLRPLLAAG